MTRSAESCVLVGIAGMTEPQGHPRTYAIRTATEDDWADWIWVGDQAFGMTHTAAENARERSIHELDRSLGAYDGDTLVGTAASYSLRMTLPGGVHPVAGVTWVSVLPSHRRRGILSALMRAQLHGLHSAGGEPVAVLWASEAGIYGRFGYGAATQQLAFTLPRGADAIPAGPRDPSLRMRLVPGNAVDDVQGVRRRVVPTRPGLYEHDDRWAARAAFDPPGSRHGASALRCVLAEDSTGVRGYARYATSTSWAQAGPAGVVRLRDVHALDPAAYAALWRFVCDIDLTTSVEVRHRPIDDPLLDLLADYQRALPTVRYGIFARLVDLDRALALRRYCTPVDVVLDVRDDFCPWNAGRWRLVGSSEGSTCTRTDAAPDLALSATELGAVYLGGGSLERLAGAGRVQELRPGALRAASAAFRHDPAPACDEVF